MPAGYTGTPLAKKLGLRDGEKLWAHAMPRSVRAEIEAVAKPAFVAKPAKGLAAAHVFHTEAKALAADLKRLRTLIAPDGQVWVSWPKKAAPKNTKAIETDITEDAIRALALPMGYVDVKVCAVDEVWSGLKLVIRKALRGELV